MIRNYFTKLFGFVLPRFCPSCLKKLEPEEDTVCKLCFSQIRPAYPELIKSEYFRKYESKRIISGFVSQFIFEKDKPIQQIIHSLKYDKKYQIGIFLGKNLGEQFRTQFQDWNINLIVPIPLHHLKKAERGFNQSYYIAKGIASKIFLSVYSKGVKRIRFTQSQTTMTLKERELNVEGAFKVLKKEKVKGKNILLVDDVMTTGATINECGKVLLEAGANKIYATSAALAAL